jgi:hypothetical protein
LSPFFPKGNDFDRLKVAYLSIKAQFTGSETFYRTLSLFAAVPRAEQEANDKHVELKNAVWRAMRQC